MPHPIWIFDLDNTLHNASRHAFPVINQAMTAYLSRHLDLTADQACNLRQRYWQRYGATLTGLMRHHPHIDPHHFLHTSHPMDELLSEVHPMPDLRRTLLQLRGRKVLFTNGTRHYAERLLDALGINDCFDAIVGVDDVALIPKPRIAGYRILLHKLQINPRHCIMVEDSSRNLIPAKRLGMRTVWLRPSHRRARGADVLIYQLSELVQRFR